MINDIEDLTNDLLFMIDNYKDNNTNNIKDIDNNKIPNGFIPLSDDEINYYDYEIERDVWQRFEDGNDINQEIIKECENQEIGFNNYQSFLMNSINNIKSLKIKNDIGYIENDYHGDYLRNCLTESSLCDGINGDYNYDIRKSRDNFKRYKEQDDKTVTEIIINKDKINIVGLLQEPINKTISYHDIINRSNLLEKIYLNELIRNRDGKEILKNINVSERVLDLNSLQIDLDENIYIKHNLDRSVTKEDFFKILKDNLCKKDDIIDNLMKIKEIKNKILNFNDLKNSLKKYDLEFNDLDVKYRKKINKLINHNIKNYIRNYRKNVKYKLVKNIKLKKNELTDENRVQLSKDYIFSLYKENERNYYIKKFIKSFTRKADKDSEDNNYLYNKYDDKKLLCSHYLYSCEINNDNDKFKMMRDIYGDSPKDGVIYCKVCGEELCLEDFSLFEGFDSEDKVVKNNGVLKTEKLELTETERKEYLEKKEETIEIINKITSSLGINLEDKMIYDIIISFNNINNDELSDFRYEINGISTTDIYPRINEEIKKIKTLEKEEKSKDKLLKYKKKREKIINDFQKWLKTTNKLLTYVSLILLFIQTSVPIIKTKKNIDIFDIETKNIKIKTIEFVVSKIKNLCLIYEEKFWKDNLLLFEDSKYKINDIVKQIGKTVLYCMTPNFPIINKRIDLYEKFIESEKRNYLNEEWVTYRPLKSNKLILDINNILKDIEPDNSKYYRKLYSGYLIENNSLIRGLNESYNNSLVNILNIPQFNIIKNKSFTKLFRYIVSCYGKTENNILITLLLNEFLDTIEEREDIIKIFKKYGWSETKNGFNELNFNILREKIIPEIFNLYNKQNNNYLRSCYSDEKTCNSYIHNSINNYDLSLLNTLPKRLYQYKTPLIYPETNFSDMKPEIIDKLFSKYKLNNFNELTTEKKENVYLKYDLKLRFKNCNYDTVNEDIELEKNKENFDDILNYQRTKNSLSYHSIQRKRSNDTLLKPIENKIETRYPLFYEKINKNLYNENELENLEDIYDLFLKYNENNILEKIDKNTNKVIKENLKLKFSNLIEKNDEYIQKISEFLVQSDFINDENKKQFNKTMGIKKGSIEKIMQIMNVFINDDKLNYNFIMNYLKDIHNVIINIVNNKKNNYEIPKEWQTTDNYNEEFIKFINRNHLDNSKINYELLFHKDIFTNDIKFDLGFESYHKQDEKNIIYLKGLYIYIKDLFDNLELIKHENKLLTEKYTNIFMKHHFLFIYSKMIDYVNSLINDQTDIAGDANEIFRSLEQVNEDDLEDSIKTCSSFIMDSLSHILMQHYDTLWLFMNFNGKNILSKQKEREKQNVIQKLDGSSQEDRFMRGEKNKIGISNFWKDSNAEAAEFVKSKDYKDSNEQERLDKIKEIYLNAGISDELFDENDPMLPNVPNVPQNIDGDGDYDEDDDEDSNEHGYLDDNDIEDENQEEYMGDLDDEQEMEFNE